MTLEVSISAEVEATLRERAAEAGEDVADYAAGVLERIAQRPRTLEEISGPIHRAFIESGMTEDELGDLLEREKHAMRAEKRAKSASASD